MVRICSRTQHSHTPGRECVWEKVQNKHEEKKTPCERFVCETGVLRASRSSASDRWGRETRDRPRRRRRDSPSFYCFSFVPRYIVKTWRYFFPHWASSAQVNNQTWQDMLLEENQQWASGGFLSCFPTPFSKVGFPPHPPPRTPLSLSDFFYAACYITEKPQKPPSWRLSHGGKP